MAGVLKTVYRKSDVLGLGPKRLFLILFLENPVHRKSTETCFISSFAKKATENVTAPCGGVCVCVCDTAIICDANLWHIPPVTRM